MAAGILGRANIVTTDPVVVYTVPSNVAAASVVINICNRSSTSSTAVKLAMTKPGVLVADPEDYIEFNAVIPAASILERTALVLGAGCSVVVESLLSNVSVQVYGFEGA